MTHSTNPEDCMTTRDDAAWWRPKDHVKVQQQPAAAMADNDIPFRGAHP
jgi:hypothetical protein